MFFSSPYLLEYTVDLQATAHDYLTPTMTVLFHGPPTRGPVMNVCESGARAGRRKKKKTRSVAAVSLELTCTSQQSLAPALLCTARIMQRTASRAALRPIRGEDQFKHAWGMERPSTNQRSVPGERVHRGTWLGYAVHVSETGEDKHCCCVKCKCSIDAAPHWHS